MIFMESQRALLKARARTLLLKLEEYQLHKEEWRVDFMREALEEACSMGHAIAMDEVHSTPWEFLKTVTDEDAMNQAASEGWELLFPCDMDHVWLIWRRRKGAA